MRTLKIGPGDPYLQLKRLLRQKHLTALQLSAVTGLSYDKIVRTLRNQREFTASEIAAISDKLQITDIKKYFLGGQHEQYLSFSQRGNR